jgi:DNA invertase Pin-like site-specific DNA recombinase
MTIRAVAYYRMSDDSQEQSIPAQREAVQAFALRQGYEIIREYKDEGISGDDTGERAGFLRLVKDAAGKRDFEVILCWDQDRFGRFDSVEAGYWIKPLRDAGVQLVTIPDGPIDWNTFAGRLVYQIRQEGKHAYLVDLSRNTARGMARNARDGFWNGGKAPVGLCVKDRRLAPGDPEKIELVLSLFRAYAETDTSLWAIVADLNARGIPSPGGGKWHPAVLRRVLTCPAYKGEYTWNRRHQGKYHGVAGGEVRPMKLDGYEQWNPEEEWFPKPDAHQAIVPAELWDAVQAKLVSRRTRRTPRPGGGIYLLTGLVYCGHCGKAMYNILARSGTTREEYARLICASYQNHGLCGPHRITQAPLLAVIVRKIQERFTDPEALSALWEEMGRQLLTRQGNIPQRRAAAERQFADLAKRIERGAENLLAAPPDLREALTVALRKLQTKRAGLQREMAELSRPPLTEADLAARIDQAAGRLADLDKVIHGAPPARVREVMREAVSRVECWFDRVPFGNKLRSVITRGVIHLWPDGICRDVALGGPSRMPAGATTWKRAAANGVTASHTAAQTT